MSKKDRRKRSLFAIALAVVTTVVFGPVGGKVGSMIAGLGAKVGLSQVVSSIVFRAGLGIALGALAEGNVPRVPTRGYETTQKGTALNHQIIYGKTRVAGAVLLDETTGSNNKFLHRVIAIAGHEINSYEEIWLNDYKLTVNLNTGVVSSATNDGGTTTTNRYNNYVNIRGHLGSPTQSADTELVNNTSLTSSDKFSGIAYLYVKLTFDQEVFPNGIPEIQATVKGKKVFDPRDDTTAWSDNPALCIRDYLISDYGLNEDADYVDDDLVGDAADYCDVTASDSNNFFSMNGAFTTGVTPADLLADMLTSMQGILWYSQGQWRMRAAPAKISQSDFQALATLTLNEDDLRSPVQVGTRHSRRDNFNVIKGTFRGEGTDWQVTDYPEYKVAAAITDDGEQESVIDMPLPFTSEVNQTQRIARIAYERNRQQLTVSASFGLNAFKCQVGDFIRFDYDRMNWGSGSGQIVKYWEVVEWSFGVLGSDLQVNLVLREVSHDVYDEVSSYTALEKDNTTLQSPFDVQSVTVATPTATSSVSDDGTVVSKLAFTWSVDNTSDVDRYVFAYRIGASGAYNAISVEDQKFEIEPAVAGATYYYFVQSINHLGIKSSSSDVSASGSVVAAGDTTAPATPAARSPALKIGGYRTATIGWTAPSDDDLKGYKVYRSTSNSQPASEIALTADTQYTDSGLDDATTYYYWVEAFDNTGNDSGALAIGSLTTLDELVDGESGLTLVMSNENHTFAANSSGTISSYAYSGTTIRLFEGSTELAYDGVGTSNGTWKISTSATSITRGTLTDSGNYVTIGSHSNMTADTATIEYTITGKRANGDAISLTKSQSFTKAKDGATGAAGQDAMAYAVLARNDAFGFSATTSQDIDPMTSGIGDHFLLYTTGTVTLDDTNDNIDSTATMYANGGNVNTKNYIAILSPDEDDANSATALSSLATVRANLSQIAYNYGNDKAIYDVVQVYTPMDLNGDTLYLFKVDHVSGDFTQPSVTDGTNVTFEINYQLKGNSGVDGVDGARGAGRWNVLMPSVAATALVANKTYLITSVGTTNFSSIDSNNPACQNVVGAEFLASGVGTGTGTAVEKIDSSSDADTLFTSVVGNPVDDDQAFFFSGTQSSPDNITVWIYDESSDTWTEQTEFIDGDLLVTGTVTTSKLDANAVTADKIQAGEVNASKLTIDDELILQNNAGFIAGRNFNSDYATSGFFVGRETRADNSQGFELSSSSTDRLNRITGLLHNEQDHLQLLNPTLRFGGSATGASTNYTTSSSTPHIDLGVNTGRTITVTALGGGGGGGGGHANQGDNQGGTGDPGGTTTVVLYDGPVANNVVLKTITSAGGAGGQSGGGARGGHGTDGGATAFGAGGTGGGENLAGSNAPNTSYGAGGGGGGGDDSSLFDHSGAAGLGGNAATATVENVAITSSNNIFAVITIGGGGDGDTDGISYAGGNGADGVAAITSVLGGMNEYESEFVDNILKYTTISVPTTNVSSNMDTNNVNTYPTGSQAPARVDQDADDGTLIIFDDITSSDTNGDVYFQFNGGTERGQGNFLAHINTYADKDGERTFSLRNNNATVTEIGKLIHTGGSFDSSSNKITINTNEHLCEWMYAWNNEAKASHAQTVHTAANYQVANGVSDNYWSLRTFSKFTTWTNSTDLAPSSSTTWSDLEGQLFRMDPTGGINRIQIDNLSGAIGNNDYKITLENTTLSGTNSAQFTVLDAYAGNSNTDIVIHLGKVSNTSGQPYGAATDDMSLTMPAFEAQTKRTFYVFEHTDFTYLLRPQDITRDEENGTWEFDITEVALASGTAPSTNATYSSSAFTLQNAGTTWSDETWGSYYGNHRVYLTADFITRSGLQYIYLPAGGWMSSDRTLYIGGTSGQYVTYENISVERAKELLVLWKTLLGVTTTTWGDHL